MGIKRTINEYLNSSLFIGRIFPLDKQLSMDQWPRRPYPNLPWFLEKEGWPMDFYNMSYYDYVDRKTFYIRAKERGFDVNRTRRMWKVYARCRAFPWSGEN